MTVAALVAVMAVACAWLVLLVTLLSRCVPFDCRQALVAWLHAVLGQGCSLPVHATTGFMVQTVQKCVFVQFLHKVMDMLVECMSGAGRDSAENCGGFAVAVLRVL